ncbi:acetyl-CoA carboxylase biotin carboxylase subunit [Magnetofaba australis]|uniref:propionyl-CoA carboxylase n=1 Tax=Magnetofaba australis IT-1 TaxID=1434232 RepID=A0A1Y2K923_9PROT|nr:acetyl/propionyl/methylcrotonyl-CoA carboxylase subunit alpha [Magnetofaba australis]OSM07233.1 putative carbamoyl-phosphate synthase subunit L [Magnetofaba australis IT-1]
MKKILIANRGEIACRVIRTARQMGIATVAVYSEADAAAKHVRMADEAVCVGPAPSNQSYLVMDNILTAIKQTGADAVHPGYGFLSENPVFRETLDAAGIAFIGPDANAMRAMGDKISSKILAKKAGVNTIPGSDEVIESAEQAVETARQIGYPVMIKASAGGGGKGMRIAYNDSEAAEGWQSATNEGVSYFGDGRVFIEKFIESPRHIEIQVLCDAHGNGVWLNERECSIQRRNQKVIEEAPSPFLDPQTRRAMGDQAVALAKAVGYQSAGTVEFVMGADKGFYFLEMNTRLQVEHPVTEMTTGLDLVEQMIRVARGEPLAFTQDAVPLNGWAIECRVYAEDPYRGFLPSVGRLSRYEPPAPSQNVRVDDGVYAGGEVSLFYDPMIAKLITWGEDRQSAIDAMGAALDNYLIDGPGHNMDFLNAVLKHPRFVAGNLTTGFLAEEYPEGFSGAPLTEASRNLFAMAAVIIEDSWEQQLYESDHVQAWVATVDGEETLLNFNRREGAHLFQFAEGHEVEVSAHYAPGMRLANFSVDGLTHTLRVDRLADGYRLTHGGRCVSVTARTPRLQELARLMPVKVPPDTSKLLMAPMPGLVLKVMAEPGKKVAAGDALCVLEAMKMENIMKAEKDAVVESVAVKPGDTVEADAVLVRFE